MRQATYAMSNLTAVKFDGQMHAGVLSSFARSGCGAVDFVRFWLSDIGLQASHGYPHFHRISGQAKAGRRVRRIPTSCRGRSFVRGAARTRRPERIAKPSKHSGNVPVTYSISNHSGIIHRKSNVAIAIIGAYVAVGVSVNALRALTECPSHSGLRRPVFCSWRYPPADCKQRCGAKRRCPRGRLACETRLRHLK
jgi:hypothetical protein